MKPDLLRVGLYRGLAILLLLASTVIGLVGRSDVMWMTFTAFLVFLLLSHLGEFSKFSASWVGISAETRKVTEEAKVATRAARELSALTARIALSLLHRTGRIGGYADSEKAEYKKQLIGQMRQMGVDEASIERALEEVRRYELMDYQDCLIRVARGPGGITPEQAAAIDVLSARRLTQPGSPDEFEQLLKLCDRWCDVSRELVADYRYFLDHSEHRRMDWWSDRMKWSEKVQNSRRNQPLSS